jgi:exopolysaccharide biosynthesis polyprenyl glycosylphosphotransferase
MRRIGTHPAIPVIPVESEQRPLRSRAPHAVDTMASGNADAMGIPGGYRARAAHALHGRHSVHRAHSTYGDKAAWYLPLTLTADVLGSGVPVALLLHHTGQPHPLTCALVAAAGWLGVRTCRRRYTADVLGENSGVLAVLGDWLVLLGVLAVLRTAFDEISRPSLALVGVTVAPLLTLAGRRATHRHLMAARRSAQAVRRVLVISEPATADHVVEHLAARTEHPYVVVGVVPVGSAKLECGAPVTARLGAVAPSGPAEDAGIVLGAVREHRAELVLVSPGPRLSAERLRRLSWALHDARIPLAVLPGLVDVAVRRIQLDAPAGLAMMHIAPPTRQGVQVALKTAADRAGAALGLLLLLPLLAATAVAIRLTSPGPAFHRQTRHGRAGTPFTMWKFRTMVADAEARKAELELTGCNENDGLMFKMRRDPRITRIGQVLRRCSIDELPQLVNVLRGEMSLVGPRPPLPDEAARYDEVARRRLSVKPGITGLWQVSGRSELSWDETLAIDLRYVDNWSLSGDVDVMARTMRAVVDGRGAY